MIIIIDSRNFVLTLTFVAGKIIFKTCIAVFNKINRQHLLYTISIKDVRCFH